MRRFLLRRRTEPGNDGAQASPSTASAPQRSKPVTPQRSEPKTPIAKPSPFNPRQAAFIGHYVVCKNATEASIKAGYSKKTARQAGAMNMSKPAIRAEIERRLSAQAQKLAVTADRVRDELAKIAFGTMGDFVRVQADGSPYFDLSGMTPEQAATLDQITVEEFKDGRSDKREVRRIKLKLHDKTKALEMLGKHFNMFVEQHEHKHDHQHTLMGMLLREIDQEARGAGKLIEHQPARKESA